MCKAVIFDLFETLITENHPEWHVEVPAPGKRLGLAQEDFNREWSARYQARMTGELRDYGSVLREVCSVCGVAPPEEEIASMQAERVAAKARPFDRIEPLVVATLERLRGAGYRIGVITNCSNDEIMAWESSPLSTQIDVPIFSCKEGVIKPMASIYELACNRLGVDQGASIFVGDGGSDELRGADAAGMKSIWATWFIEAWPWDWVGNVADVSSAFPRCRNLTDLPSLVDTMFT